MNLLPGGEISTQAILSATGRIIFHNILREQVRYHVSVRR